MEICLINIKRIKRKEIIVIVLVIVLYSYLSYKIHIKLLQVNKLIFCLISVAYLTCTYFLFDFLIYIHSILRDRKIYFEFGHAEIYYYWKYWLYV